jgi:hypothetical protein
MDDVVVTVTSCPLRIGVKTDSKGSAFCLIVWIYANGELGNQCVEARLHPPLGHHQAQQQPALGPCD